MSSLLLTFSLLAREVPSVWFMYPLQLILHTLLKVSLLISKNCSKTNKILLISIMVSVIFHRMSRCPLVENNIRDQNQGARSTYEMVSYKYQREAARQLFTFFRTKHKKLFGFDLVKMVSSYRRLQFNSQFTVLFGLDVNNLISPPFSKLSLTFIHMQKSTIPIYLFELYYN